MRQHDAAYCADALLALVDPSLVLYQRRQLGYSPERIKAGMDAILTALLESGTCPGVLPAREAAGARAANGVRRAARPRTVGL